MSLKPPTLQTEKRLFIASNVIKRRLCNEDMVFKIQKKGENLLNLVRIFGYRPLGYTPAGELNCVRKLGGNYPRFHLYIKEEGDNFILNLHLDQKKPSYEGAIAHSGDYNSELVFQEAKRIKEKTR